MTVYNTGKVLIGVLYNRPMPIPDYDAVRIQKIFLDGKKQKTQSLMSRFLYIVNRCFTYSV